MKNRLPVIANEVDASRGNTEPFAGGKGSVGVDLPKTEIQLAEFASREGLLLGHAEDFLAQRERKVERSVAEQFCVQVRRSARDASEGNVDAVGGRAGHEAKDEHVSIIRDYRFSVRSKIQRWSSSSK